MADKLMVDMRGVFVSHYVEEWQGKNGTGRRDTLFLMTPDGDVKGIWCPDETIGEVKHLCSSLKVLEPIVATIDVTSFPAYNGQPARTSIRLVHVERQAPPAAAAAPLAPAKAS